MNTPSHLLMNAALGRKSRLSGSQMNGWLWGAVVPDLMLYLLTLLSAVYYPLIKGRSLESSMRYVFDVLYFNHPLWKAAHNLFHAPFILGLIALIAWRFRAHKRGQWGLYFAGGCVIHTVLDMLTHVDDGPLIFFPFDWHTRFRSSISYWDPRFHGRGFSIFEASLDALLLLYLVYCWFKARNDRLAATHDNQAP